MIFRIIYTINLLNYKDFMVNTMYRDYRVVILYGYTLSE